MLDRQTAPSAGEENAFTLPVNLVGGCHQVEFAAGPRPILLARKPARFLPRWRPTHVYAGFAPLFLLELQRDDGQEATWFLDRQMHRIGGTPDDLPPVAAVFIQQQARQLIRSIWHQLVCLAQPRLDARAQAFFTVNEGTRLALLRCCQTALALEPQHVNLTSAPASEFAWRPQFAGLAVPHLAAILEQETNVTNDNAVATGFFCWPSPVDGEPVFTNKMLCPNYNLFAYRLAAGNEIFYVVMHTASWSIPLTVYFPARNCAFGLEDDRILPHFKISFGDMLLQHLMRFGGDIPTYLNDDRDGRPSLALMLRNWHPGHHLWNELTEVDRLVQHFAAERLPEMLLVAGAHAELYGDLEALFPELQGKVERRYTGHEIGQYIYRDGRVVLGPNRTSISRQLAQRILRVNLARPSVDGDRRTLARFKAKGAHPVVLLGIRIENRTVVDLRGFCAEIIRYLLDARGAALIAFDGYNAETEFPHLVEAEQLLVEQLRQDFADDAVEIVSTIGEPMARSLFWAANADFFVAPWGAGMAKYCWIANKPGLVVSSRWNLKNRGDFHIYSRYTEDPAAVEFLPETYIEDDPDAPRLIDYPYPHRTENIMNFRVDMAGVYPILERLLRQYSPSAAPRRLPAEAEF